MRHNWLKTLAFTCDNGFVSEQAKKNMEAGVNKFNVDFIGYKPNRSKLMQAYRISFLKTGDFCILCNRGVTTTIYKFAFNKRIPLIVLGYCSKTDAIPREIESIDHKLLKSLMKGEMSKTELRGFLLFQPKRLLIKRINLPDFINWKEQENFNTLNKWLLGEANFEGEVHYDCLVSPVAEYLKRLKWGFGKKEMKYSIYIRDGQMTRKEALRKLPLSNPVEEPPELKFWMKELNLTKNNIERSKNLSYSNYKSYSAGFLKLVQRMTSLISPDDEFK